MVHPSGLLFTARRPTPTAAVNKERVVLCFILLTIGISEFQAQKNQLMLVKISS
jgi:hypothetical protein